MAQKIRSNPIKESEYQPKPLHPLLNEYFTEIEPIDKRLFELSVMKRKMIELPVELQEERRDLLDKQWEIGQKLWLGFKKGDW
ncbi:MAG: hypothetical protein ACHQ6U_13485 [Thermodesulfobacteriota bacterium]